MSRSNEQLPPRGKQRPHSFDIGLQERQGHQGTSKRRGVYKSGTGTFMFASTSMSAALDNLQFYPKATEAQLTSEHRATIRETVISQLAPLRNFPKAHSYPGVVTEPYSPASSHSDRRSAEVRRSVDYRRSADGYSLSRPPMPPLPPSIQRGPLSFAPHSTAWSPAAQVALSAQRGSTDMGQSAQTREQQIAEAAGSSFFASTVAKPAAGNIYKSPGAANPSSNQAPAAPAAVGHNHTAQELPHAAAVTALPAPGHCISRQHGGNMAAGVSSLFRNNAPLHGKTPSAALPAAGAAKPQYTRATRGSFHQPQTRPRGSCDLPQSRGVSSFEERADRSSFEQAYPRGRTSFDQLPPSFQGSMSQPPQLRSSLEQTHHGGRLSFEESQLSLRRNIDQLHAAGKGNVAQLQAAARSSFEHLQARATAGQATLGAIPEQGIPNQPPMQDVPSLNSFTQLPGASPIMPQYPFGQFVEPAPSSNRPYSLARASCDYPQPVPGSRASADFPRAQGLFSAQLDRAASSGAPASRHSLVSSQEFARLDEPTKRRAAAAALGVTNFPPNQFWPEQNTQANLLANAAGSPFGQMDAQAYQPHALQLHALNTLNALNRSAQPPHSQSKLWNPNQMSEHSQADHGGFAATSASFPQTPPATSLRITPATLFSNWSPRQLASSHHSRPENGESPARSVLTDVGANASDLQGTWGAHLDASAPTPSRGVPARGQSYSNPFLQPQSTFSIREAKLQLQNPTPRDFPEGEGRAIPRVNTFASNLHDSWGAHALHDSPPATEGGPLQDPPRLSTESARSATSQASKASSGACRPFSVSRQGSGKFHHGYGYDPSSDGWKVDCSSGTQRSFSTYTVAKPQGNSSGGIISAAKELLAEAANAARSTDACARRTSQDGTCGISPLLDLLVESNTPLPKKRRILETLTFLAANSAIAYSICEQGGVALLLQVAAGPNEGVQLEAAETVQALMMHSCAQDAFGHADGLFRVAPMLAEHLEPISHLAGLHILASYIYCRRRPQDEMAQQLHEAGLYELALNLLKIHSQFVGQGNSSTHRDTLDWLEASQGGSPMAPLPEDQWELKGNLGTSKGSSKGSSAGNTGQPPHLSRSQLTTAQTLPPPNLQSPPATTGRPPLLRHMRGTASPDREEEGGCSSIARAANTEGMEEEDLEGISGDVMLADQVVLAVLEVLFKLASNTHHLQAFRPELVMEAVGAQLHHGRHPRALARAIQLLQACSQRPALLLACARSECVKELVRMAQGSGHVASLASGTLATLVQSEAVRAAVLEVIGARPVILTDVALPGGLHLLSCLAEFGDSRQSMLQAGLVPALISLANKTPDAHTCASATSLLRLLTNSTDRCSTDGIHGSGLDPAGDFGANVSGADGSSGRGAGGYLSRGPCRDMYRQHRSHAFQGFFQI